MKLTPDTGKTYAPGTVGAELAKTHTVVSRAEYFAAIRRRLVELVDSGIREDVLIGGLRDDVSRRLRSMAGTERTGSNRSATRADLERWAQDSDKIARFRARMARSDPSYASRSDDEVAKDLREMADRIEPVPLEQELVLWAVADRWNDRVALLISDEALGEWLDQHGKKMTE
jgi:hypothetical protein